MTPKIKSLLFNTCGTISYLIVIFFFVTFILFLHNDVEDALKEAWSVSTSFLSVLATLGAAIIAAYLFNDWREEEAFNRTKSFHDESVIVIIESAKLLTELLTGIQLTLNKYRTTNVTEDNIHDINAPLHTLTKETIISIQNITHDITVKILMDYSGTLNNNDPKLNFVFGTVVEINTFVKKVALDRGINPENLNYIINFIDSLNRKLDQYMANSASNYRKEAP